MSFIQINPVEFEMVNFGKNGVPVKYFTNLVKSETNFTEDWRGFEANSVEFERFL